MTLSKKSDELFWMSFANEMGFLGACLVRAYNVDLAVRRTWELGINPGGEIMICTLERGVLEKIPDKWIEKMLVKHEVEELDVELKKLGFVPEPADSE